MLSVLFSMQPHCLQALFFGLNKTVKRDSLVLYSVPVQ